MGGGWGRRSQTLSQPVYLLYCLDVIYGVFLLKLKVSRFELFSPFLYKCIVIKNNYVSS